MVAMSLRRRFATKALALMALKHRVGVGFLKVGVLLPFYADLARKPTFTILHRVRAANFYRVRKRPRESWTRKEVVHRTELDSLSHSMVIIAN